MTSTPIRDPATEPLLTPGNTAIVFVDIEPIAVVDAAGGTSRAAQTAGAAGKVLFTVEGN